MRRGSVSKMTQVPYRRTSYDGWFYDRDADWPYRKQGPDGTWWYIDGEKYSWWVSPPKAYLQMTDDWPFPALGEAIEDCEDRMYPNGTQFISGLRSEDMIQTFFGRYARRRDSGVDVPVKLAQQWNNGLEACKKAGVHPVSRRGLWLRWVSVISQSVRECEPQSIRECEAISLPPALERVARRRQDTIPKELQ